MMKKLSYLPLLLITVLFICGIIYLTKIDFLGNNAVSLCEMDTKTIDKTVSAEITSNGKININTASKETLSLMNGIGEALAGRIITYREENGPYTDIYELLNVKGIGETKLRNLAPFIAIE